MASGLLNIQGTIDNVRTYISTLATWKALCKVSSSDEAIKRIFKGAIEFPEDQAEDPKSIAPCCVVDLANQAAEIFLVPRRSTPLAVKAEFQLAVPSENTLTYADQYDWTWGKLSDILKEIAAGVNGSGGLDLTSLAVAAKPMPFDPDEIDGRVEWGFTVVLSLRLV